MVVASGDADQQVQQGTERLASQLGLSQVAALQTSKVL
jgi:hypothetical protein